MEESRKLIALAIKCQGNWNLIYKELQKHELLPNSEVDELISSMPCKAISMLDEEYPEYLKEITYPPFVLFYYGNISLIKDYKHNLAVIGSREYTNYGEMVTKSIVRGVRRDINIVSGLARGIDAIAHQAALDSLHHTIAVLGSGIDICFPLSNKDLYEEIKRRGLVISEYPPGTVPQRYFFPMRNRIVAAISRGVLITESKRRSGTMITVLDALCTNRLVFCVPSGDLGNSGCNLVIKEGAHLVESAEDINDFYRVFA